MSAGVLQARCTHLIRRRVPWPFGGRHPVAAAAHCAHTRQRGRATPRVRANAAEASDFVYPNLPGDNQSSVLYTALQTPDDDVGSSAGSVDESAPRHNSSDGDDPKGPWIPQRWRIVISIGKGCSCTQCIALLYDALRLC